MAKEDETIARIFKSSAKAELIEELSVAMAQHEDCRVIAVVIADSEKGKYTSQVLLMGVDSTYEAYGILEVAKYDLQSKDG